jgi:hypothetical protein
MTTRGSRNTFIHMTDHRLARILAMGFPGKRLLPIRAGIRARIFIGSPFLGLSANDEHMRTQAAA